MSWLQFIDSMFGRLAWPIVVLIIAFAVRKHLGSLADRIVELSFGGATVKFGQLLSKGAELIEHVPTPALPKAGSEPELKLEAKKESPPVPKGRQPTRDNAYVPKNLQGKELWDTTGAGQIINAYEQIEDLLFRIGDALGVDSARSSSVMSVLIGKGAISDELADLYKTMRNGRNLVAHARALPSAIEVQEYVRQASFLRDSLQFLKHKIDRGEIQ